jgi:ABC-type glycerol-3-phosphate transport system permease component
MDIATKKRLSIIGYIVFFILVSLAFIFPFYWMFISSIKPSEKIFSKIEFIPKVVTLSGYRNLFSTLPYGYWYLNSLVMTGGYVIVALISCTLGGFALAHYRFKLRNFIFIAILISQMIPFHLMLIPLFITMVEFRMIDTYVGAFLPIAAHPIGLFFMRQYMLGINRDLLDAARIDGASEFGLFFRVVLPLTKPGISAMAIFFSMEFWNNLLWPLVVMRTATKLPLIVGIASLVNQYRPRYDLVMAASFLSCFPLIILFLILQKHFVAGMGAMARFVGK